MILELLLAEKLLACRLLPDISFGDNGKLSWLEKVKVGFFKQKRISALSAQLQNWKITIDQVFNYGYPVSVLIVNMILSV